MIKFISKMFGKPGDEEFKVELETQKEAQETKEETYNRAVRETNIRFVQDEIGKELTRMCYTKEEIEQTEEAKRKFGEVLDEAKLIKIKALYPKASIDYNFSYGGSSGRLRLSYDVHRLTRRLAEYIIDNK